MNRTFDLYLITGATGHLGTVLIHKLLAAGKRVRALVLDGDPGAEALPPGVELTRGNVAAAGSMDDFFAGDLSRACLIHCAGLISIATRRSPRLWQVNVEGTRNVMEQCLLHRPARVVHVSSVHAIPELPAGQVMREIDQFSPQRVRGQYAKSKAAGTQYALDAHARGLDVSVVHPSGIIGPYDRGTGNIASTVISFCRRELPAAVEGGYDFVDIRDAADGILSCCERGRSGACYILSGHYATLRDILGHLSRAGCGKEPRYLPLWTVKLISPFFELASLARRRPLFLTPYSAYTLGSNARFSHERAAQELGYRPRALGETLDDMVSWLAEQGIVPAPRAVLR